MTGLFPETDEEMVNIVEAYDNEDEWRAMVRIAANVDKMPKRNWIVEGEKWYQTGVVEVGTAAPGIISSEHAERWCRKNYPGFMSQLATVAESYDEPWYINWLRQKWENGEIPTEVYWGFLPPNALEKLPRKEEIALNGRDAWLDWLVMVEANAGKYVPSLAEEVYQALKSTKRDGVKRVGEYWSFAHTTAQKKANISLTALLDRVRTDSSDAMKVTVASLLAYHAPRYNEMRKQSNSFLVNILLWIFGNTLEQSVFMQVLSTGIFTVQRDKWSEVSKKMHELVHSSCTFLGRRLRPDETSQLMYFDILYGRSGETPNWEEARVSRAVVPPNKQVYDLHRQAWSEVEWEMVRKHKLFDIINPAIRKAAEKKIPTLEQWCEQRFRYGAGGTASGLPQRYKKLRIRDVFNDEYVFSDVDLDEKMSWLKKGILEHSDIAEWMLARLDGRDTGMTEEVREAILDELGELPTVYNVVSAAPKPEELGNKVRELYASYMADYLLQNYILSVFEKLVDHPDVDLGSADDGQITRDLEIIAENGRDFKVCWDYADFNAQHTGADMQAVFEQIAESANTYGAPPIFAKVARWLGRSMHNTIIVFPGGVTKPVLVHHTLMSGWRGTTFLNTILNACYLAAVEKSYQNFYATPRNLMSFRKANGDDVVARVKDWGQGLAFLEIAEKTGLVGKLIKQRLDPHDGEYLRVSYFQNSEARTSLCRGLATLVTGNWIGTGNSDLLGKKEQIAEQLSLMRRRGLSPATSWLCEKILRNKLLVVVAHNSLAKGGIVFAPSGSGKTTFIHTQNRRFRDVELIDGDSYIDWNACARDKTTMFQASNLIQAFLDVDRDKKFIVMVHPCAVTLGLERVPSAVCIPNERVLARNLQARSASVRQSTSLRPAELRQMAYSFAMYRGLRPVGTLFDAVNIVAQQLDSTYRLYLRMPDWLHRVSKASGGWGTSGVAVLHERVPEFSGVKVATAKLSDDAPRQMSSYEVRDLDNSLRSKGFVVSRPNELIDKLAASNYASSLNNSMTKKLESLDVHSAVGWWRAVLQFRPDIVHRDYPELEPIVERAIGGVVTRFEEAAETGELETAAYLQNELAKGAKYTRYAGHITKMSGKTAVKIVEVADMDEDMFGVTKPILEQMLTNLWADQIATADIPANWKPEVRNMAMLIFKRFYDRPKTLDEYNYQVSAIMARINVKIVASTRLKYLTRY
jgi:hypothetical protein